MKLEFVPRSKPTPYPSEDQAGDAEGGRAVGTARKKEVGGGGSENETAHVITVIKGFTAVCKRINAFVSNLQIRRWISRCVF